MLSEIFEIIKELLKKIWDFIKKIFVKILNFAINIIKFFRDKQRIKKLNENKKLMAIAIKEKLENGNFRVVNCCYNKETEELEDMQEDAKRTELIAIALKKKLENGNFEVVNCCIYNKETEKKFGNKDS